MADPLDAYNKEIQRRSGPFGLDPAQTRGGAALQLPLRAVEGLGGVADLLLSAPEKMGAATLDYLTGPSQFVRDAQAGRISESEIPLGVDLVDIFGETDPTLGIPDFVPDDYEAGEIFKFDPTGKGKTKGIPETKAEREAREAREISEQFGDIEFDITNKIDAQLAEKAEKKRAQRAEDFRRQEAKIADMTGQGTYNQSIDTIADSEQMFASAMQDYIEQARGTGPDIKDPKSLDEYKKEFADATGIDISGKPDKSQALMAFGLALMQNKAGGKGITGMLGAIGEAGQAAMPALEKARQQARQDGIAAGKFALEMRSADQAKAEAAKEKAMERSNYFVVPRSDDVKGFLAGIGEGRGRLESLSKYELNKLQENPEFSQKFDILPAATWSTIVSEAMKTPEAKEYYDTKSPRKIELFGEGANNMFTIETWRALPNSGRENILVGSGTDAYKALADAARDIDKAKEKFITGMGLAEGVNIFRFGVDKLDQLASTLGFNMREGLPPTQQLRFILDKLQAQNAPEILGEAGKTISDADRQRVAQIVGDLNAGSTADEITFKLNDLFNEIILKKEQKIMDALGTLNRYTGRNIGVGSEGPLNEEESAELAGYEGS